MWHRFSVVHVHVCVSACVFLCEGDRQVERCWRSSSPETFISHYPRGGGGVERRGGVGTRKARPEEEDDGHIKRAAAERGRKESEGNDNAC